jgi:hypothetical protein
MAECALAVPPYLADRTATTNDGLGSISLYRIARREVDEGVGVEEVTWHYLKIFDWGARW